MATSAERRIRPAQIRRFGSGRDPYAIPDLTQIQTRGYEAFLQRDVPSKKRADQGLEINEADVRVAIGAARTGALRGFA